MKALVLSSGGLDSTAVAMAVKELVKYGAKLKIEIRGRYHCK